MKEAGRAIEKYQPLWSYWQVEELIGQGNGSELYKVYKEEWGKRYTSTVKLLSFSIGKNDIKEAQAIGIDKSAVPEYFKSLVGNILNEIELMYKLRGNSNIVIYEDHEIHEKKGDLGWDVLIRMEFLQPLPDFLAEKELERLDVVKLGIDICKALEACGREKIIHRDIKDSSIFVSPKGEFKLGSFSMAKELSKGGRIIQAQFNHLYMAPELYKEQSYDFSVDTYSLGIVMYKLLNKGRLPFLPLPPDNITVEDTERSVTRRMKGERPELPLNAGENLGNMILKACSYDRKDRYKSPYEFRQKLERFLKTEVKSVRGDIVITNSIPDYTADEANYEETQVSAEKEEADVQTAYAEELGRIAVVELASSVDRMDSARKQMKRKLIRNAGIWISMMVLAFAVAFIYTYEAQPDTGEPISETAKETVLPSTSPTLAEIRAPEPTVAKSGEEYFQEGLRYMKAKRYESALSAFNEAKRLGYESRKADSQIRAAQKQVEVQELYNKASNYYEQQDYEKAINVFEELAKADAAYTNSDKYADSFFKLAEKHNALGMRYYNEGKMENSVDEFDTALELLEKLKKSVSKYNVERYAERNGIYAGNKSSVQEKIQKIEACLKLADEYNKAGVNYFSQGFYYQAKREFESALRQLAEIRLLVPKYTSNGYDGLMKLYEENLKRAEEKL